MSVFLFFLLFISLSGLCCSETMDQSVPVSSSARATASTGKPSAAIRGEGGGGGGGGGGGAKNTTTILHTTVVANSAPKTASLTVKSGGVKKTTKTSSTKVSAMAAAKITKAVARARQAPQQNSSTVIVSTSPLIVSLPLGTAAAGGGWGKPQPQATPQATPIVKHTPQILSLSSGVTTQSTTAAILASIPVPAKPPRPKPLITTSAGSRPAGGKGLSTAPSVGGAKGAGPRGGVSSSSSSSSSSDSEDSASDSSSSGSSHGEEEEEEGAAMDTGGPVPIVHSVPVPAGAPQLLRPKAIVSPVKAPPPKLIPMGEQSSVVGGSAPSPLATPTGGGATRFLWSNRVSVQSGGEATPTMGFVSIAPLMSPTSLTKPSSGSAFQLVTSPPGSAPLARPPSLQDEGGVEPGKPHPPP